MSLSLLALTNNRVHLAVAYAAAQEATLLTRVLGGRSLLFAHTAEEARALAVRPDVGVLLVLGDEGRACELVSSVAAAEGPRPRVLFCAATPGERLIDLFNQGAVFRWVRPPLVPAVLGHAVEEAVQEFAWEAERGRLMTELVSLRRPPEDPAPTRPVIGTLPFDATGGSQTPTLEPPAGPAAPPRPSSAADAARYRDPLPIAEGGMGAVVSGLDTRLGRRVALKTLHARHAHRPDLVGMMAREARVTGALEHPNIIPIYDAGRTADGLPFYVMKLVEAPTMHDVLKGADMLDPDFTALRRRRLLRMFVQVCQAVDFAHSRGVIHCDLKPANVLVGSFGQVLVVDWGLAYVANERTVYRGGTLGYVSPEQMEPGRPLDARTDVYALGAMLYDILCLRPPFEELAYQTPRGLAHPGVLPVAPHRLAAGEGTPEELEEICLRALAVTPDQRFPTAGAVGLAVDAFLEGTKDRERRTHRADELARNGDELAANYHELVEARLERLGAVETLRAAVAPWLPAGRKQELWDAEDSLAVTDRLTVRTLQVALSMYERALEEIRDHEQARAGLARLYAAEAKRAEQRRDDRERTYFEGLVEQYDDGGALRGSTGVGTLSVTCAGGLADVVLFTLEERDRCTVPERRRLLGATPIERLPLVRGAYLVEVAVRGGRPVRFPILVGGGEAIRLQVDPRAADQQGEDEVLIPGGPALVGGDDTSAGGLTRQVVVPTFFMQILPVSWREYLGFLTEMRRTHGAERAMVLAPRQAQSAPVWEWTGDIFVASRRNPWGIDPAELLETGVFGVDQGCVEAFASWRSRRSGLRYRLPTELEWEKAARGTDGRLYPWGNRFDASFCCMRESSPDPPRPRPRGLFATDRSPFGVRDVAGGLADWALPATERGPTRELLSRGGAWSDWPRECLAAAHRPYPPGQRPWRVGFRLVRPGPATVGYTVGGGGHFDL